MLKWLTVIFLAATIIPCLVGALFMINAYGVTALQTATIFSLCAGGLLLYIYRNREAFQIGPLDSFAKTVGGILIGGVLVLDIGFFFWPKPCAVIIFSVNLLALMGAAVCCGTGKEPMPTQDPGNLP